MVRQTRTIAVPVFCGLCFFLYLLTIPTLRLPLSWGVEDFFIADILHTSLPLRVAPLQTGEFWRIITYALLHGSWWHTLLNLFGLWITGNTLERVIGWRQMTLILLIGAVAGAAGMIGSLLLD
ncbi:MAG: rhomboid family intramembrane serine protease, partial [Kiritimatiellae bacterium]|nr:rhomboid family intramembrane serine protease [Kiritimatiellia bacterium]